MLHVFLLARRDPAAVAHSLAALVPAVVLGHVGHVVVQTPEPGEALRRLLDEAGCALRIGQDAAGDFAAERNGRPGWWLAMRDGQVPIEGWSDDAMRHIALQGGAGLILPARGVSSIGKARAAALLGRLSTRHHMLLVPPERSLTSRSGQLAFSGRAAMLRTAYES